MATIQSSASDENFAMLQQDPFFDVITDLISGYLADAFDDPAGGEVERWTLSALPSTNSSAERQRLFTLNVGPMEVLFVERFTEGGEIVDYRTVLYVSESALTAETGCTLDELALRTPLVRMQPTSMAFAEGDGVMLDWFLSDEGADEQFFELPLDKATRPLAEHLVTKGRGPYAQDHNRSFAAHVLAQESADE
ncbi:hypothetical protein [Rhodococcus kronopolitis]|uniref:Uncharacterized protein n=1 Tax=Rhodococcus kronopolitis TaxID=1460226 RepID=A0ABV9FPU6_9NOCA